ncbi:MAG: hypothetical protein H6R12_1547, partial [Proteobacteria bacterium]|nr:hypothetical protein [Pseudomonadota bacterium]
LKAGIEELNAVTTEFAARRMNQSIRKAFTGQRVDELSV